ncbi:MAG: DUF3073 domain-containing protein [Propioniciclava sp.]|uniref:DUF3073 domain-containing protein n=1 Tax=Propioniciclava sp. TaxID=2038686 RepID=UPI0039E66159
MGRGRAKAKQTKVARDLKYRTFNTDFSSLERELRGESSYQVYQPDSDEYDDAYSDDGEEEDYPSYGRTS